MKKLSFDDKDYVFCRSFNGLGIQIYRDGNLEGVVKSNCPIQDYSIVSPTGNEWTLFCLTVDGKLYGVHKESIFNSNQKHETFSEEDDIFQDLLTSTDLQLKTATEPLYQLNSSHVFHDFKTEKLTSLCVYNNIVLAVSQFTTYYEFKIYGGDFVSGQVSPLTLKRTFTRNHHNEINNNFKTFYIISENSYFKSFLSSDIIIISDKLFTSFFGTELSLLKTLIIFVCPSFGSVFYTPMKYLEGQTPFSDDKNESLKLFCQTSQHVIGLQYIEFLSEWEADDIDGESENQTEAGNKNGLIVVTADGKCYVISSWRKGGVQFVPMTVPGPVECCDVYRSTLYHSNDRDVFESQLTAAVCNNDIEVSMMKQNYLGTSSVCNLVAVRNSSLVEGAPCKLLCQSRNNVFELNTADLKVKEEKKDKSGQQIKDVLVSLEKCQLQREQLITTQTQQNSFISQLSIANFLICSKDRSQVFSHKFWITYSPHSLEFTLNYELTNQSKVSLSCDWRLILIVQDTGSSLTKSIIFNLSDGLRQNECVSVALDIPEKNIYLPFEVKVYLQLQMVDGKDIASNSSNILPVFLISRILDIIYFVGDEKHHRKYVNVPQRDIRTVVSDLAFSRPISHCLLKPEERSDIIEEPVTLLICKPLEVMQYKEIRREGKDETGLLKYLLEDCSQICDINTSSVQLSVCSGPKAVISVDIEDKISVSVQSTNLALCTALRLGVLRRFQNLERKPKQTMDCQVIQSKIKTYQDIYRDISNLEEVIYSNSSTENRKRIKQTYKKLRHTNVLT